MFEVHYSIVERGCPYKEFVDIIGLAKQYEVYFPLMVCMKIRVPAEVLLTFVLQRFLMRLRIRSNNVTLLLSYAIVQLI